MTKKRRLFISIVAGILAALMVLTTLFTIIGAVSANAVSQSEIDALNQQKQGIAGQKEEIREVIADLQAKQATVLEQKAALDKQNELTRQEIELINEQIDIYAKVIENKAAELEEAMDAEKAQMEQYRVRMRAMEENGAVSYIGILFQATSFSDFLSRLDIISEIMDHDKQLEDDYISAREHVEEVKAEYEEAKIEEEVARVELLDRKEQLEGEIQAAYELIVAIESDIESNQAELEANEAEEARVQAEIDNKIAELQRQEEAAKQAAQSGGTGGTSWSGGTASGTGTYVWPLPSNSNVSSGFGYRIHPIFGYEKFHSGVDIGGTSGSSIVAADAGTVIVATYSSSYGYYVVVSHGGSNSTLYAHMTSYCVSVGQTVAQGETIGYVGSTGWSTGPHLHFEVKIDGVLVDPLQFYTNYVKGF